MRRSKRNTGSFYGSPGALFEDSKVKLRSSDTLKKSSWRSTIGTKPEQLIIDCFGQMRPHTWLRLVPSDGEIYDTVAFAMDQKWELSTSLFEEVGCMKKGR